MTRAFDPHCLELAEDFLSDEAATKHDCTRLAQHIQNAIEDWIAENIMRAPEEASE